MWPEFDPIGPNYGSSSLTVDNIGPRTKSGALAPQAHTETGQAAALAGNMALMLRFSEEHGQDILVK